MFKIIIFNKKVLDKIKVYMTDFFICLIESKWHPDMNIKKGQGNLRVVELRVASCSCELRVASCRFGSSTVLFDCVVKIVNWCWDGIVSYFVSF